MDGQVANKLFCYILLHMLSLKVELCVYHSILLLSCNKKTCGLISCTNSFMCGQVNMSTYMLM